MLRAALLFLLLLISCHPKTPKDPCAQFEGSALAAPYHIFIGKPLKKTERKAVQAVIDSTFSEIDSLFNNLNPASEISRINAAPTDALIPLSPAMQDLLAFCDHLVALSGGRFDPTVEAPGWSCIKINNGILKKTSAAVRLDLRGLLKGLAIDSLTERIQKLGFSDLFVEWAGEMRASGRHPTVGNWPVQINPRLTSAGKPMAPIPLRNRAIVASGNATRETAIASVTVIAPSCILADALAIAAMVFPTRQAAEKWAQEVTDLYPDVSFWILSYGKER